MILKPDHKNKHNDYNTKANTKTEYDKICGFRGEINISAPIVKVSKKQNPKAPY